MFSKKYIVILMGVVLLGSPFIISKIMSSGITNEGSKEIIRDSNIVALKQIERITTSESGESLKVKEKNFVLNKLIDKKTFPKAVIKYIDSNFDKQESILNLLTSFDYLNGTTTKEVYINFFTEFNRDSKEYKTKSINLESYPQDLTFFPKEIEQDDSFKFMLTAIQTNKKLLQDIKEISNRKDVNIDYKLALAGIFAEQIRYAMTERGAMKQYIKRVPFLFSMTQYSYGIGGVKSFTAEKIVKECLDNGIAIDLITKHSSVTGESEWKDILTDKYWEGVYPTLLTKLILLRWEKEGYDISKNPGVVATLYNFGNSDNKKPNANPKVGGADISIKDKTYNFGGIGEGFYWYLTINENK